MGHLKIREHVLFAVMPFLGFPETLLLLLTNELEEDAELPLSVWEGAGPQEARQDRREPWERKYHTRICQNHEHGILITLKCLPRSQE